jgi:hypothetical protein
MIIYRVIQEESAILWEMIVCVILSKKSSHEHGSDFEWLPRYGKKENTDHPASMNSNYVKKKTCQLTSHAP